jgi:hypothetical protein
MYVSTSFCEKAGALNSTVNRKMPVGVPPLNTFILRLPLEVD